MWLLFPQEKLKLITVLGAGLLCGTALAVIIPEGVHALYEEILEGRVHHSCSGSVFSFDYVWITQNLSLLQLKLVRDSCSVTGVAIFC